MRLLSGCMFISKAPQKITRSRMKAGMSFQQAEVTIFGYIRTQYQNKAAAFSVSSNAMDNTIQFINDFIAVHLNDIFKDTYVIMLTGSRSLGFINNPNDLDLTIILDPALPNIGPFGAGYLNKSRKYYIKFNDKLTAIDFHYHRLDLSDYKHYTSVWMFHFNQLLWARDDVDFDLLRDQGDPSLEFLRRNLSTLVPSCLNFLAAEKEGRAPRKQLYYIYGMTCVLTHQTFNFTDEEKRILNELHDRGGDRTAIVEWCESQLQTLGLF